MNFNGYMCCKFINVLAILNTFQWITKHGQHSHAKFRMPNIWNHYRVPLKRKLEKLSTNSSTAKWPVKYQNVGESVEKPSPTRRARSPEYFSKESNGRKKKEGEKGRREEKYLIGVGASVSREILRVISRGMEGNSREEARSSPDLSVRLN